MAEGFILNRMPQRKRDVVISMSGRITLRSRVCRSLSLKTGDKVVFYMLGAQMYVFKDNTSPIALRLSGRPSQLHCCSVETARNIIRHTEGANGSFSLELLASGFPSHISVNGVERTAVAIINIFNKVHFEGVSV